MKTEYTPKWIHIRTGKNAKKETQVKVELPNEIFTTAAILATIEIFGLKL